ncbi:PaaX family transcriptional regulator, partial [Arthrobacter deserti]|nr:PaaX family transcriptional regulator [Arthrobacter deserti]
MASENVPQLPRHQQGAEPQRLLTTLFGDYWLGRSEHLPSAALVRLLAGFVTTAAGARAATQRLAARRFLVGSRNGRETAYGVPPRSREVLNMHLRKLFGTPEQEPWDGQWTIVAFSVPEQDRAARRQHREAPRSLHFGRLYDALWVSPRDRTPELAEPAAQVRPHQPTAFRGADIPVGPVRNIAAEAFELAPLAEQYRVFVRECRA